MSRSRLLSILAQLAPREVLRQATAQFLSLFSDKCNRSAPDLECLLRREVGLPHQPLLFARNTGNQFTVTADLQSVGIDSLHIEISPQQFSLSGWVLPESTQTLTTAASAECGWFSSARAIPPSMDLDHFTLHYHQGQLVFCVPRKHLLNRRPSHTTVSIRESQQ